MKHYKFLVPILLILLFVSSFYMLYDQKATALNEYNGYIKEARRCHEQGILTDAQVYYNKAMEVKPSLELSLEIGRFYLDTDQGRMALDFSETMVDNYPKDAASYEFRMELLCANRDYAECFSLANEFTKRGLSSEKMSSYINEIEYKFFFSGKYEEVGIYSDGLCPVRLGEEWGYANTHGALNVECVYQNAGAYSSQLAPIVDGYGDAYYIDAQGNKKFVVTTVQNIVALGALKNDVLALNNGISWGFYDKNGTYLFGEYESVSSLDGGVAAVMKDESWMLVNREGKQLTAESYQDVILDESKVAFRNERCFVNDGTGYKMIDSTGKTYGTNTFEDARIFNDSSYAAVLLNGKWGFVDSSGNIVIEPQYDDARSFSYGYAAVKKDGRWGFIDKNGKIVIEPQFNNAKDINANGCVFVVRSDKWELLRLYKYNY